MPLHPRSPAPRHRNPRLLISVVAVTAVVLVMLAAAIIGPGGNYIVGSCAVAPMLVAIWSSRTATAITGALTTAGVATYTSVVGELPRDVALLVTGLVAGVSVIAVAAAELRRRQLVAMATLGHLANVTVDAVLNPLPSSLDGLSVSARYIAAAREAAVGGDCYDVVETPFGVRAFIGDVKGKGLPAVRHAARAVAAFSEAAHAEPDLADVIARMDTSLGRSLTDPEDFVTALVVELPHDRDTLRIARAGHPSPVLLGVVGRACDLDGPAGPPLGLGSRPRVTEHPFPADATVLLYTDGLSEARRGQTFLDVHTAMRVARKRGGDTDAFLDAIVAYATRFGGSIQDDLALVALRRHPAPVAAAPAGVHAL